MRYYPGFTTYNLFDDFFNPDWNVRSTGLLKTDIRESNGFYTLHMEVPGYKKEDIQIELSQGYLKVTATRTTADKNDNTHLIRKERHSERCSRSFYVGNGYRQDDIKAAFDNGILKITLPTEARKEEETKKMITIE